MIEKSDESMNVGLVLDGVVCAARWLSSRVTGLPLVSRSGTNRTLCNVTLHGSRIIGFLDGQCLEAHYTNCSSEKIHSFHQLSGYVVMRSKISLVACKVGCGTTIDDPFVTVPDCVKLDLNWVYGQVGACGCRVKGDTNNPCGGVEVHTGTQYLMAHRVGDPL